MTEVDVELRVLEVLTQDAYLTLPTLVLPSRAQAWAFAMSTMEALFPPGDSGASDFQLTTGHQPSLTWFSPSMGDPIVTIDPADPDMVNGIVSTLRGAGLIIVTFAFLAGDTVELLPTAAPYAAAVVLHRATVDGAVVRGNKVSINISELLAELNEIASSDGPPDDGGRDR